MGLEHESLSHDLYQPCIPQSAVRTTWSDCALCSCIQISYNFCPRQLRLLITHFSHRRDGDCGPQRRPLPTRCATPEPLTPPSSRSTSSRLRLIQSFFNVYAQRASPSARRGTSWARPRFWLGEAPIAVGRSTSHFGVSESHSHPHVCRSFIPAPNA